MPDVVVVGAGFAGLSAATALVDAGADVLVVEARPTLGGRASSFRDPETGEIVDNGQHVLVGCYHATLRFLARIGAAGAVHRQASLQVSMIDRDGSATSLVLPPLPSPLHLVAGVLSWRALSLRDRISLLRIGPALRRAQREIVGGDALHRSLLGSPGTPKRMLKNASRTSNSEFRSRNSEENTQFLNSEFAILNSGCVLRQPKRGALQPELHPERRVSAFADETVRAWLLRHGQSDRLCELLWEPLALAALNQSIDHAAAPYFVGVLARMFGPDPGDAALVLPARPLSELYAEPARRRIEAGGGIVRTHAPGRIVIEQGAVRGVRVRGELIPAGAVIAAVPWFALSDVFEEPVAKLQDVCERAARTPASPIVTVNLWVDRPVLDGPVVGLPGRRFQWVFDRRAMLGNDASHLSLVSSGAEALVELTNDQLTTMALGELRAAIPAARGVVVRKASAVRERRATFSLAPGLPMRPSTETAVSGLFLAGDWIDTGLPATIESAVLSGERAAAACRAALRAATVGP